MVIGVVVVGQPYLQRFPEEPEWYVLHAVSEAVVFQKVVPTLAL